MKEMENKSTMLISALKQDIEVIKANRSELMSQIQGGSAQQPEQAQEESEKPLNNLLPAYQKIDSPFF